MVGQPRPWLLLGTSVALPTANSGFGEIVRLSFYRIWSLGMKAEIASCVCFESALAVSWSCPFRGLPWGWGC